MENTIILETLDDKPPHILLPDLPNLEVESVGYSKIKVTNFKNLSEDGSGIGWHSSPIELCNRKWRILFFPYGTKKCPDAISVFLDYFSPKDQPRWSVCAQFSIDVICEDESMTIHRESQHRFTAEETDWGFSQFYHQTHFYSEEPGKRYVIENSITAEICVRVLKDPTGILWHNFLNYDSKLETGYVGLKNQGATCYMNSLLQSLYFTSAFKKAVYRIPCLNEDQSKSIPLALQRVFFQLEHSERPVGTIELTKSFGWDSYESFMQHDVQEFNRVLCDKLENKMKGTPVEGAINRLFEGKMKSYVKCINVDYESSREEAFYDIQLNVKGMKNLEESFKDYIQVETLDGDNKYFAEGHGLQDAKKGVIFLKYPPVLHLQLKRFEYDVMKDSMVKINDKHEFPDVIDLKQYVINPEDEQEAQIYHLHGVLVHSGDVHGGHYCAFIKPKKFGEWLKFDDDRVTRALPKEAMDENFGVDAIEARDVYGEPRSRSRFSKKHTNAYMLVYIRETDMNSVLEEATMAILPEETKSKFLEELRLEEERRKEKEEQHLYVNLKIATEEIFEQHHFNDLCNFDPKAQGIPPLSFKVKKQITFGELKNLIAEKTRIKESCQRLWFIQKRQNSTYRPDEIINLNDNDRLEKLKECNRSNPELKIFVEKGTDNGGSVFTPFNSNEDILLFIKSYEAQTKKLQYEFNCYLKKTQTPDDLLALINQRLNRPPQSPLKLFEEVRATIVEKLKSATFEKLQIGVGDIIIYQEDFEEVKENAHLLASSYFEYLLNRIQISFKSRNEPKDQSQQFTLELSKKMKYDEVSQIVGQHIGADPMMIQFVTHSVYSDGPKNEIKREEEHTLENMLQNNPYVHSSEILYYEKLDISISEMETKKRLSFFWITPSIKEKGPFKILINQTGSFKELVDAITEKIEKQNLQDKDLLVEEKKDVEMTEADSQTQEIKEPETSTTEMKIRVYEVYGHKILKLIKETDSVKSISDYVALYAERIPPEQISIDEHDQIVQVVHFHKDPYQLHGVPFYFLLKKGEPYSETLKRLNEKLEITEKEWGKYKFGVISNGKVKYLSPEDDKDYVLCNFTFNSFDLFGIDHPDKNPKQSKWVDRAVVIRN